MECRTTACSRIAHPRGRGFENGEAGRWERERKKRLLGEIWKTGKQETGGFGSLGELAKNSDHFFLFSCFPDSSTLREV